MLHFNLKLNKNEYYYYFEKLFRQSAMFLFYYRDIYNEYTLTESICSSA